MEPEHLRNVEWLNPWQLEYAGSSVPFHPLTELKNPLYFQPLAVKNREPHSTIGQGDPPRGMLNLTLYNSNSQLASVQGARHLSDVSVLIGGDTHQTLSDYMFQRSELSLSRSKITEVNLGGHQSGNLSTESHSSLCSSGTEIGNLPKPCSGINSIQLFGKLVYVNNKPGESQSGDAGCFEKSCTATSK